MTYAIVQLPFAPEFHNRPAAELKIYREWFLAQIPLRITELTKTVAATAGFERWIPDYSVKSIEVLGMWLVTQVETRPRTQQEINELGGEGPYAIEVAPWELTDKTFSLAMDIGMYLGETMRHLYLHVTWKQQRGGKTMADYGQMVLDGFGRVSLNPVRICVMVCYGIAKGRRTGTALVNIFQKWADSAAEERKALDKRLI